MQGPPLIDKRQVRRAFDQAAATYDEYAVLQHEVGTRLLERLDYMRHQPQAMVDIGAGTGLTTAKLLQRYPKARCYAVDLSPAMLQRSRRRMPWYRRARYRLHAVCGDAERLPLREQSCDLLFSNLALQWCNDLDAVFAEFARVLRPGGVVLFSTLGPDTLHELRASWAAVDDGAHVSAFIDLHDVGDAMLRAGLADPVMDAERFTLTYPEVSGLMHALKHIGAGNACVERAAACTPRRALQAMTQAYERFRRDGVLPATYEVVYGHAWAAPAAARTRGQTEIPLNALQAQVRAAVYGGGRDEES